MALESCIFMVKDKAPSKEFVVAVLAKYPTAASCVIVKDDGVEILDPVKEISADDLLELINEGDSLKHRMVFWCCKADGDIAPEDMQPYHILTDGEGKVCMAAFVEGDFVSFLKTDSSFSPETFAIDEYLRPKIELLCGSYEEQTDNNNFSSVYEDLSKDEEMQAEFFGARRGAVVLMSDGAVETFRHKSTVILEQEGLWSSDHCGFGQTTVKSSKFNRNKGAPLQTPATPVPGTSVPTAPSVEEPKGVWVRKGPLAQGNTGAKEWYWALFGLDKGSVIPTDIQTSVLTGHPIFLPQVRFEAIRARPIMKNTVLCNKPESLDRTKTSDKPPSSGSAIPIPVMSEATIKKVVDYYTKPGSTGKALLDAADTKQLTLEQVQEVMGKHKDWYTQIQEKLKIDIAWSLTQPYEAYLDLARIEPQTMAIFAWDKSCRLIIAHARINELETELAKLKPADKGVRTETLTAPKPSKFNRKAG